jgi:hypothetical protein
VFSLNDVSGITWNQQTRVAGPLNAVPVNVNLLRFIPGTVGQIAFGKYDSPNYETAEQFIPPVGSQTGTPAVQGVNEVYFDLYLPSEPRPASGWPVAIFGHQSSAALLSDKLAPYSIPFGFSVALARLTLPQRRGRQWWA